MITKDYTKLLKIWFSRNALFKIKPFFFFFFHYEIWAIVSPCHFLLYTLESIIMNLNLEILFYS